MNISKQNTDKLNAVLTVNMTPEDYQPKVDKAIKEQAKKANIPGFRPGMVPPAHIKKMYGKSILVDTVNNLLNDTVNNYINEEKLEVLGQPLPKMDDEKTYNWDFTDTFQFEYELGLAPEFAVDFSSKDKLTQYVIKADEETIAERIKNIRRAYGKMTNPDVSADDDVLYAELTQLSPDGSVFEDGISNTTSVRLDQVKDEKIKKSLIGLKKDDEVTFDIQKAYGSDAAKIAAILKIEEDEAAQVKSNFRLAVKNINRLEEGDLNQEFFDKLFGAGTVTDEAGFRAKIVEEIEAMMNQDSERRLQNDIYNFAIDKQSFELPDEFLKRWLRATNEKLAEEELQGGYQDFAKNLKWTLIANKVLTDNEIEVKYEEVFAAAKQSLDQQFRMYSPQPLSEEQLSQYAVQYLQDKENANKIFEEVKALKVFDYIKSVITLDKKDISYNDFKELAK